MSRLHQFIAVLILCASSAFAGEVHLRIRAVLVDDQLNQKPVPRLLVNVTSVADLSGSTTSARTDFDGTAEVIIRPGKYRLETPAATPFASKLYSWTQVFEITSDTTIDLSNDNATVTKAQPTETRAGRLVDELTSLYTERKNSVFTVWSETGHGTGFLIDRTGLIITNDHVVAGSPLLSVQFDQNRKVAATLLVSDADRDVAVVLISPNAFPEATAAPLSVVTSADAGVIEGERVFTIGSPLNQSKIVTSGVVSKIEPRAILSDITINHGNSGGPLFNSLGQVVGMTTFKDIDAGSQGVAGIIRLSEMLPIIDRARTAATTAQRASDELLPDDPPGTFPIEAIKSAVQADKFDVRPYSFSAAGYDVTLLTPVLMYRLKLEREMEAVKNKTKRNARSAQAVANTIQPLENLRNWAEYVGEFRPVLLVEARPQLREGFWSAFGRGLAASQGMYGGPANLAFRTDFYRMKLLCGTREVQPIHPGKNPIILNQDNFAVRVKDATFEGFYSYGPDAISPKCGTVTVKLFSEKNPDVIAAAQVLDAKTVTRVWNDFEPYRNAQLLSTPALPKTLSPAEREKRAAVDRKIEQLARLLKVGTSVDEVFSIVGEPVVKNLDVHDGKTDVLLIYRTESGFQQTVRARDGKVVEVTSK